MPPTRGHDLKPLNLYKAEAVKVMPPTRGHDLKPAILHNISLDEYDAPHTGARLET